MNRLLFVACALLGCASVARADLPPPPPPPPPGAQVALEPGTLVAGAAGAAGLVLAGAWLVRRNRLARG